MAGLTASSSAPPSRAEELDAIRGLLSSSELESCHSACVQCLFCSGVFRRLKVSVHLLDDYPSESSLPVVELTCPSGMIAPGVIRKLELACERKAKDSRLTGGNNMPCFSILQFLKHTVSTNRLLCCVDEVRKGVKAMGNLCREVRMNDETGRVHMKLQHKKYSLSLNILVPEEYPKGGIDVKMTKSNFPKVIMHVYGAQLDELVRRLANGCSEEIAIRASNPDKAPPKSNSASERPIEISGKAVKELKQDLNFLYKAKALRDVDTDKGKRNQFHQYDNATRKDARRNLRKLQKAETQKELAQIAELEAQSASDAKRGVGPTRSVGPALRFVSSKLVGLLPDECCQGCGKRLLPADPSASAAIFRSTNKAIPKRVYCGHWWHKHCLHKVLTRPPFGQQGCPACSLRIWHHEWIRDIKKLERAWSNKQAKKREINDVATAFGLGAEFCVDLKGKASSSDDDL